jgi:putative ABC transport system permease protein
MPEVSLLRLQLRRLRGERVSGVAVALLVFVTALALALGPRLLERLANEALVFELQSAPSVERNIIVSEGSRASGVLLDTLEKAQQATLDLEQQLPAEVKPLIAERRFVAESTSWEVLSGTQFASLLFLRVQQDIEQHVELVSGRLPTGFVGIEPDPRPGALPDQSAAIYEVMLSERTADEMGVTVDAKLPLALSYVDPRNVGANVAAGVHVVGIYRLSDPKDPYWLNDPLVAGFRFHPVGSNTVYVESDAILAPNDYGALVRNGNAAVPLSSGSFSLPLAYQWRYYLDLTRLDANQAGAVMAALRRLDAHPPHSGVSDVPTDTSVRSGLLRLMLAHEATWRSATALLAVVGIGALFVAATCLTLVAMLASTGRRRTTALVLARGGSPWRLRLSLAVEALLLSLPAAAVAAWMAIAAVPEAGLLLTLIAGVLVAGAAIVLLMSIGAPGSAASVARLGGRDVRTLVGARSGARRVVAESALVIGALAGAVALRDRGLAMANVAGAGRPDTSVGGADPLMVAVPALLGLAAGVIALRAYPLATTLVARVAAWRRGLVLALATRRAARGRTSAAVLLTLVATASVAGFAAAAYAAFDEAAQAAGQAVGAPFVVTADDGKLPDDFDPAKISGVTRVAEARTVSVIIGDQPASVIALDTASYVAIAAGGAGDPHLPAEMTSPTPPADGVLPALVSTSVGLGTGGEGAVEFGARRAAFRAVAVADFFPLAPTDERFVVVDKAQLEKLAVYLAGPSSSVFIDAPASAEPALQAATEDDPNLRLLSQADVAAELAATPVARAVRLGLAASAIAAAAYAALAVAAALILAAAHQRTETAFLRILGLSRAQRVRLIFAEHVPAAVVAAAVGAILGIALFLFVRPGLALATIMPRSADVALTLDPQQFLALLVAALLIVIPAWALAAFAQRESDPAAAVREGSA